MTKSVKSLKGDASMKLLRRNPSLMSTNSSSSYTIINNNGNNNNYNNNINSNLNSNNSNNNYVNNSQHKKVNSISIFDNINPKIQPNNLLLILSPSAFTHIKNSNIKKSFSLYKLK